MANRLIDALAKDGFDPEQYRDEYRDKLTEIIRAKAEGQPVVLPAAAPAPAKVVNLMEALRQSVERAKRPLAKAEATRGERSAAKPRRAAQRRRRVASGS
jgi:DNA end-binding protein Ku